MNDRVDSVFYLPPEEPFHDTEKEPKQKRPVRRGLRVFFGALVVLGLVYLSGVHQALFYQRTPAEVRQNEVGSLLDAERIVLPLQFFIFQSGGDFGSERTGEDVEQMAINASEIWNQADIDLEVHQIFILESTDAEIGRFLENPSGYVRGLPEYDPNTINVFLMRTLKGVQGVNGVAFTGSRAIAIADLTTVYDFRVLAHEIGHILGLVHVGDQRLLMYSGANAFEITTDEALKAREAAFDFENQG